jgi:hypothetical protein
VAAGAKRIIDLKTLLDCVLCRRKNRHQYEDDVWEEWYVSGKTHHVEHPEHNFILKYARERVFSTRGMPTWMHENFDEDNVLFDALHGELCSAGAMVDAINGMWARNKEVFVKSPRDSYASLFYLSQLKSPPYGDDDMLKDKLCGNGCNEFLNTRRIWLANMFGDFSGEADTESAGAHASDVILRAARENNTNLEQLAAGADARADALAGDREAAGVEAISPEETRARGTAALYRDQVNRSLKTQSEADMFDKIVNKTGVVKLVSKPRGRKVDKAAALQAKRKNCYIVLECLLGYLVTTLLSLASTHE